MTNATIVSSIADSVVDDEEPGNPILVATDGTEGSEPVLRSAKILSALTDSNVVVVSALEPFPAVASDYGVLMPVSETEETRRQVIMQRVTTLVNRIAGASHRWQIELREGEVPDVVSRLARDFNARVVMVGLGHHDLLDRLFGDETALRTLRASRRPVLAVAPGFDHLPRRVMFATDFSEASVFAAETALELFPTFAHIVLAHVAPLVEMQPDALVGWSARYREGTTAAFEAVRQRLSIARDVTVEVVTLQGKPSRELLEYARASHIDLIVAGSHGTNVVERFIAGSTATGLLRGTTCSVLAVPAPRQKARVREATDARTGTLAPDAWAEALSEFTRRNAGRISALEVDEPEFGALAQLHDYPLLGVAYDHNDRRVEIMVGDFAGTRRHLTRSISGVESIDIVRDAHGKDRAIRFAHGAGQTILTLS